MKLSLLFCAFITGFSFNSFANNLTLDEEMSLMGKQFKKLAVAIKRTKKVSEVELEAINIMQSSIANSGLLFPETADSDDLRLLYSNLMWQLMAKSLEMEGLIKEQMNQAQQDMVRLDEVLTQMGQLRKKGHSEFKL